MLFNEFFITFIAIFLCEFGDKTQLVIFSLSHNTKNYQKVLLSILFATILADGLAIMSGIFLSKYVPTTFIGIFSGIVFISFGLITIFQKDNQESDKFNHNLTFFSTFLLVFFSEMGDKTQVISGVFGAIYNPYLVFIGVLSAIILTSLMSLFLGKYLMTIFKKKTLAYLAGALFISMGVFALINVKWF